LQGFPGEVDALVRLIFICF
jgi:WD repeat-containing protein 55